MMSSCGNSCVNIDHSTCTSPRGDSKTWCPPATFNSTTSKPPAMTLGGRSRMCVGSWLSLTGKPKRCLKPFSSVAISSGSKAKPPMVALPSALAASSSARYSGLGPAATARPAMTNSPTRKANAMPLSVSPTARISHLLSRVIATDKQAPLGRPLHKNWIALLQAAKGVALDLERLLSYGNAIQDLIPSEYHCRDTPWEDVVSRWPDGSDDRPFGTARHPDAVLACRFTVRRTD